MEYRVGDSTDTHRFEPGEAILLCGVAIPCAYRLSGHSDGDAPLHALTNALLAIICAGDIGVHFSPDDPRWKGADSAIFVRHALESFQSQGWRIEHVNLTIVAQVPKIKPHREAMRKNVAQLLGIAVDRVNIQATTEEEMGYTGRLEGLRAKALVTARRPFSLLRWWRGMFVGKGSTAL